MSSGVRSGSPAATLRLNSLRRYLNWRALALLLFGIALTYFLIAPLIALLISAVRTTPFGSSDWTSTGFSRAFSDSDLPAAMWNTLLLTVSVGTIGMASGVYFATVATRIDCRLRSWITPAMVVMLVAPRLFFALSWQMLGNTNNGLISKGLSGIGADFAIEWFNTTSWQGMIFVSSLKACSAVYLLTLGAIMRADRSLEDAAVMSGVRRIRAFAGITLPMLTPALFAVGMLAIIEGVQAFDVPATLGRPAGIETFSLHLYDYLNAGVEADYPTAGVLSLVVVSIVASLLLVQWAVMRGRDYVTVGSAGRDVEPAGVSRAFRWFATASILAFIVIGLIAPVVQVIMGSFQGFFGIYDEWTTINYSQVLDDPLITQTIKSTLLIAVFGGFIAAIVSFAMAYAMHRRKGVLGTVSRVGSWVPLTAPGIVLAFALLWMYLKTPGISDLYGTRWLMFFALTVASVPIAVRALEGVVPQIGGELEESARMCGAGPLRAIVDVTMRLCLPAILIAWLIVGLVMTGILDVPLLFQGPDSDTVATLTYGFANNGEYAKAAAIYCLFLGYLTIIVGLLAVLAYIIKRINGDSIASPVTEPDPQNHGVTDATLG